MKKIFLIILITISIYAEGKPLYEIQNVSINVASWIKTENKINFSYLEYETCSSFEYGESYFFIDLEKDSNELRVASKFQLDIDIGTNWNIRVQDYLIYSKDFYNNNRVIGLSYQYAQNNFWITPFFGSHYQNSTYYSGFNGVMTGWTAQYSFTDKIKLFNWTEFELFRDKEHYQLDNGTLVGDGAENGINGALSLTYQFSNKITGMVSYRYANNKLGEKGYIDAMIYSLKYSF